MKRKIERKDLFFIIPAGLLIVLFYLICKCPFRFFFGVPCPGCGMTRAVLACLRADFGAAFHYHPLVFIMPLVAICLFVRFVLKKQLISPGFEKFLLVFTVVLFAAVYVIRLTGGNDVVQTDFQQSVLHKIISFFTEAVYHD